MVAGRLVHQTHVLLVDGEDLDHLTLAHTDFILLQCIVIFDHGHGRGPIAASQVVLLGDKGEGHKHKDASSHGLALHPTWWFKAKSPASRVSSRQHSLLSNDIILINVL